MQLLLLMPLKLPNPNLSFSSLLVLIIPMVLCRMKNQWTLILIRLKTIRKIINRQLMRWRNSILIRRNNQVRNRWTRQMKRTMCQVVRRKMPFRWMLRSLISCPNSWIRFRTTRMVRINRPIMPQNLRALQKLRKSTILPRKLSQWFSKIILLILLFLRLKMKLKMLL